MTIPNERLGVVMVGTVIGSVKNDIPVMTQVVKDIDEKLDSAYFEKAPFDILEIVVEYGLNEIYLSYIGRIYKKTRLTVSAELKMSELIKMNKDELYKKFRFTLLHTLLAVGRKYKLPTASIERQL